jgi:hypothetical protein
VTDTMDVRDSFVAQGFAGRDFVERGDEPMPVPVFAGDGGLGQDRATLALGALFGVGLVLLAAGYLTHAGALRATGLAAALFFGAGTAPLQLSRWARLDLRLGVAGLVGLSVPLIAGSVLVLTPLWHHMPAAAVTGAVALGAVAFGIHAWACGRVLIQRPWTEIVAVPGARLRSAFGIPFACVVTGDILWCDAALRSGHVAPGAHVAPSIGGFGPGISPLWYAGLGCLLAGIVLARGHGEGQAAAAVMSLLAALKLTPALVYGRPESVLAAKNIALVQAVLRAHHLDHGAGLHQAYSGLFAAVAWLCDLSGIHDPAGIAACWPFVIGLVAVAELRLFLGRLTCSAYRVWVMIALVVLVSAFGADYFSPQSAGFALGLGVFALAIDSRATFGGDVTGWGGLTFGGAAVGTAGLADGRRWPGLAEPGRVVLLLLAAGAMAVTCLLSPYIVGGVLVILMMFRTIRPWYVPVFVAYPAVGWALLNRRDLSGFITLADIRNLPDFTLPKTVVLPGLQRLPAVGPGSHAVSPALLALALGLLALVVLAVSGFARTIRDRSAWAYLASAGVGLALITVKPYGYEGLFRAVLFAAPWLAAVALRA